MRTPIEQKKREEETKIETVKGGAIPDVMLTGSEGSPSFKGTAVSDKDLGKDDQVPAAQWYRVLKGGYVTQNGVRAKLHEGKEINDSNYNIRDLQRQGIRLEKCEPDDAPLDC